MSRKSSFPAVAAAANKLSRVYGVADLRRGMEWTRVVLFHVLVAIGIGALASGGTALSGPTATSSDLTLVKCGVALLAVSWVVLVAWTLWTVISSRSQQFATLEHRVCERFYAMQ